MLYTFVKIVLFSGHDIDNGEFEALWTDDALDNQNAQQIHGNDHVHKDLNCSQYFQPFAVKDLSDGAVL